MKAWFNHAVLNLVDAARSLWFALWPPSWTGHGADELEALARMKLRNILRG